MNNKQQTGGYAIVIVMLFTMITLLVVVVTVASVTTGTRTTTARGQQGDRALMAASSGVNSFLGVLREGNFRGELSDLPCFVDGGANCTVAGKPAKMPRTFFYPENAVNAPSAKWDWVKTSGGDYFDADASTFQIRSTGRLGNDPRSKAVVTQTFDFYVPSSLNVSAPAALTSCSSIDAGGTSNLSGNANPTGIVPVTDVVSANPSTVGSTTSWPVSVTVSDASVIKRESYVNIGGQVFRVASKLGNTLKLQLPDPTATLSTNVTLSGKVGLVPMASQGAVTGSGLYTIPMNDVSGIQSGDTLYVTLNGTRYGLTAVSTDSTNPRSQTVTVKLGATGPGANTYNPTTGDLVSLNSVPAPTGSQLTGMPSGTPIARYIMGATSAGDIQNTSSTDGIVPSSQWKGSSKVTPAAIAHRSTLQCGDALFKQTFNMTKQDYLGLDPVMLDSISSEKALAPDAYWLGPKTYPSGQTFTLNSNALCGSGILVINGSVNMKGTGNQNGSACAASGDGAHPSGFTGVIYVMGSLSNQGNSDIHGAVVVEANTSLSTSIGGTMNINYDDSAFLKGAGRLTPPIITARPGTWRQQ